MRGIQKGLEPHSLTEHRASGDAAYVPDYDNYQQKDDLRHSLSAEQGAICCYCLQRIRPTQDGMKIEHWRCQRDHSGEQLNYGNLLGACLGGQGQPPDRQHCDTRKGYVALSKNPANPEHQIEAYIHFLGNGVIESRDPTFNDELNNVLNLNLFLHKTNRVAVLEGFIASIPRRQAGFTRELLLRWIAEWNGDNGGDRRPYCHVVVYWLRKKLAKLTP